MWWRLHDGCCSSSEGLHTFSSKTNLWTPRLVLLEPPAPRFEHEFLAHKTGFVITMEGGTLAWVDLWRGVMLCNVLDNDPVLHYIPFPKPMAGNMKYLRTPARAFRDVICSDGFIRLIEIEETGIVDAARSSNGSRNRTMGNRRTTKSYKPGGWIAVTWKTAYVSKGSIWPVLMHNHPESSESENLVVAGPVWSMHEEDIFYLMVKTDLKDKNAWALTINVRKSTLEDMASFSEERHSFLKLGFHPFALSKCLNMTLDNSKGILLFLC